MPYIEREKGVRIHYNHYGRGFPIVFLHGFSANAWLWTYQAPVLAHKYNYKAAVDGVVANCFSDKTRRERPEVCALIKNNFPNLPVHSSSLLSFSLYGYTISKKGSITL